MVIKRRWKQIVYPLSFSVASKIFKMATDIDHMTIHSGQYDMYKVM